MTKLQMAEWLFKRISKKVEYVRDSAEYDELITHTEDLDEYLELLKDIVVEAVKL